MDRVALRAGLGKGRMADLAHVGGRWPATPLRLELTEPRVRALPCALPR